METDNLQIVPPLSLHQRYSNQNPHDYFTNVVKSGPYFARHLSQLLFLSQISLAPRWVPARTVVV